MVAGFVVELKCTSGESNSNVSFLIGVLVQVGDDSCTLVLSLESCLGGF